MSHTERRSFLAMATASLAASMSLPELLHGQVVGQLPPESLPQNDTSKRVNVMAIAAHPGDAFFAMGLPVSIATYYGSEGSLLSLSLGEKGSATIPSAQYGSAQRIAAQKAAEKMGAKALFLDYHDGEVPMNNEISFAVCDLIRQYKPNVIVTHWKGSMHKDHRACYKVVDDAIFYAGVPGFLRKDPPIRSRDGSLPRIGKTQMDLSLTRTSMSLRDSTNGTRHALSFQCGAERPAFVTTTTTIASQFSAAA